MPVVSVVMVFPAVLKMKVLFFTVAVRAFDVFGHVVRGYPDKGAVFHKFERFGEEDASMPGMVAFNPGGTEHQVGISTHILEYDAGDTAFFEMVDHFTAALKGVVPESDLSGFIDQGKPFGFAEQGRDGALRGFGFDGYSDHAKSFIMIFTHLETVFTHCAPKPFRRVFQNGHK
jgi:hypothetical protein